MNYEINRRSLFAPSGAHPGGESDRAASWFGEPAIAAGGEPPSYCP